MSILILSPNNKTNFEFIRQLISSSKYDYPIKCLIIDETADMCDKVINSFTSCTSLERSDTLSSNNINHLYISTASYHDHLSEINRFIEDCDYAFLDTHYWKHQNPEMELKEWRCLATILNEKRFSNLVITSYEDTRNFATKMVSEINGFCLPHWDARAEGISYLNKDNRNITYLYSCIYYDELLSLFKENNNHDFICELPIDLTTNIYMLDRGAYSMIAIKCLLNGNRYKCSIATEISYKLSGELLNIEFIIYIANRILNNKYHFRSIYSPHENLLAKEWYNYFLIHKYYTKCNNNYNSHRENNNIISRDIDLTSFIFNSSNCFYSWLKDNKDKYSTESSL